MKILIVGTGTVASTVSKAAQDVGHSLAGMMNNVTESQMGIFDYDGVLIVSPEAAISTEMIKKFLLNGKSIFVIAGQNDGLAAFASASGVTTYAYPPSQMELSQLMTEISRAEQGNSTKENQYVRATLGSDMVAKINSHMATRKIVVTSPKGGTGKTTTAVNLAVGLALTGSKVYLVDADANTGAIQYHLRMKNTRGTLIGLIRREAANMGVDQDGIASLSSGAKYLDAFTAVEGLPTLKVLPGFIINDVGDEALNNKPAVERVINGLYEAAVASGGVIIMDVGINPAHGVHQAAIQGAEAVAIVVKPEVPDLAETRRWISRMIGLLGNRVGTDAAYHYISGKVKLCYNQALAGYIGKNHEMLLETLKLDNIHLSLAANGILPLVDPHFAYSGVNSDSIRDILVWRFYKEHPEELAEYVDSLFSFACNFVPTAYEAASRVGLVGPKAVSIWKRLLGGKLQKQAQNQNTSAGVPA